MADKLLTTRELEELLQLDRVTIYREAVVVVDLVTRDILDVRIFLRLLGLSP